GLRLLQSAPVETLITDALDLYRRWRDILDRAARLVPPARLDPPRSFGGALAAALPGAPCQLLVDNPAVIPDLRAAFPSVEIGHLPQAKWPIELDAVFDQALAGTIGLAGGGSIHIEPARTAVLIDVDSGSPEAGSPKSTGLAVNIAAAEVIAR